MSQPVYVCPECLDTAIVPSLCHKPMVEYVPREQSAPLDKLLSVECANGHVFYVDGPSARQCPVCGTSSLTDGPALNSCRDATGGEDDS